MAITIECDRCHQSMEKSDTGGKQRGFVIQREYCRICIAPIDKMLLEIDDLHDDLALQWSEGLAKIREKHNIEGGLLPDVRA